MYSLRHRRARAGTVRCVIARSRDGDDRGQPPRPEILACDHEHDAVGEAGDWHLAHPEVRGHAGEPTFQCPARPRGGRCSGLQPRGTPTPDRSLVPQALLLRARGVLPARRRPADSPVRQLAANTVTEVGPSLAVRLARQDPSCTPFELVRPRLLSCSIITLRRSLEADQEFGDQVGTLLSGQ